MSTLTTQAPTLALTLTLAVKDLNPRVISKVVVVVDSD